MFSFVVGSVLEVALWVCQRNRNRTEHDYVPLSIQARERGKVPPLEYKVLQEHRVEMVNTLVPDKLIPFLERNNVIDHDDVEKIEKKCKDIRRKGAETMLDILYNSGSCAFTQLIEALKKANYHKMAQNLSEDLKKKKTDPQPANTTKQRGRLSGLEFEVLRNNHERLVNELDSNILKNHLFENKIIDKDDMEKISKKGEELRKKGAEEMLDIIYKSGSSVFAGLLKSLNEAGYVELSSKLAFDLRQKETDPYSANTKKKRGRLSGLEYEVLRDNHERLINELDSSVLKNHLFQNELIDEDDMEKISKKEEELRKEGAEEMLNIIYKSGSNAFPGLLKSLRQAGYVDLYSKLKSDLKQTKKKTKVNFPDYSHSPNLETGTMVSDWKQKFAKWKKDGAGESWCDTMKQWFKDHEYKHIQELKLAVEYWLLELGDVVDRGCLEVDKINVILDVTEAFLKLDSNNTNFVNDKLIFEDAIKQIASDFLTTKDKEKFVKTKREEKQRLFKQQQQVFEKLKDNLEGIIEGKRNRNLRHLDTESCKLARYFRSVADDVRERWNELC